MHKMNNFIDSFAPLIGDCVHFYVNCVHNENIHMKKNEKTQNIISCQGVTKIHYISTN